MEAVYVCVCVCVCVCARARVCTHVRACLWCGLSVLVTLFRVDDIIIRYN